MKSSVNALFISIISVTALLPLRLGAQTYTQNVTLVDVVSKKLIPSQNEQTIDPANLVAPTPESLVQQQVDAYNAGNIEAFLEPYADDVELYLFPDKPLMKGKDAMRQQYSEMFNSLPDLHCQIKQRIVQGNIVIDKEVITGAGHPGVMEATVIYEISNDKITKVYFIQ